MKAQGWMGIALFNFLLAGIFGNLMRYAYVNENLVIPFKNILHAHSHMALLGWAHFGMLILIIVSFIGKQYFNLSRTKITFLILETTIIAMFVSFAVFGYQWIAVGLLFTHMAMSIILIIQIIKNLDIQSGFGNHSDYWLKAAFFFMIFSFLGPLALGPINYLGLKGSVIYYVAIQFFLHFQFNGWLIFAVLALFFRFLENQEILINKKLLKSSFWILFISCFLTFALAVARTSPDFLILIVNSLGVTIQCIGAVFLGIILFRYRSQYLRLFNRKYLLLFEFAILGFYLKVLFQFMVVIPYFATIAYTIRNYIIGFIHLLLLGLISLGILAFSFQTQTLRENGVTRPGILLLLSGIAFSEILLFLQGTYQWASLGFFSSFYELLLIASMLIPLGIIFLICGHVTTKVSN